MMTQLVLFNQVGSLLVLESLFTYDIKLGMEESAIRGGAIATCKTEDISVAQLSDIMNIQYLLHMQSLQSDGNSSKPTPVNNPHPIPENMIPMQPLNHSSVLSPSNILRRRETATHLVVFVHGYQGKSQDMTLFASTLSGIFPSIKVCILQLYLL